MGQWTLNHHDEVLRDKMKNLVTGAIQRASLEGGPAIAYEAFVAELDVGDSFTTSLMEILVNELADRRTRPTPVDRRLISERTAKRLRLQTAPLHIYRERMGRFPRRRYQLDVGHSEEEDDTLESSEQFIAPEGVRLNSDLYDAYAPHNPDMGLALSSTDLSPLSTPASSIDRNASPMPASPPSLFPSRIWRNSVSGSSWASQNNIRHSSHSRATDFNNFTSHRRSTARESELASDIVRPEESQDGTWRFSSVPDRPSEGRYSTSLSPLRSNRQHFPLTAWSDPHLRINAEGDAAPQMLEEHSMQSSSQLWYSLTSAAPSVTAPQTAPQTGPPPPPAEVPSQRRRVTPRLRRGGVRAPESMLPRQASPLSTNWSAAFLGQEGTSHDETAGITSDPEGSSQLVAGMNEITRQHPEQTLQLLTPRSPDSEL